ncbi:putative ribosomal protein S4/S9 [Helianthus annuus]|nr:putative ribosomal protein S4/S9 [Helianthus annuus]
MPALRFKTCRLLEGNVWNRELTIIQRRILQRLRNKTRSVKRMIYSRKNLNSYIQLQTTRKLPPFHGDLPITRKRSPIVYNSSFYSNLTSCSTHQSSMKRKIKSSSLSTHYSEVNHRTPKAVLSYGPNIGHIPHVRQEHIR